LNILFVANRFPYPPYRGDKLKIFNLAKRLAADNNLFLITFIQDKKDYEYVGELEKIFKKIELVYLPKYLSVLKCGMKMLSSKPFQIIYFESAEFRQKLKQYLNENEIDIIHTQHLRMSQYTENLTGYKRILDLPDAYSLYWERRTKMKSGLFKKLFHKVEFKKVLKYEEIIKKFDLNLVCSEEDKDFLIDKHKISYIDILPNGVDLSSFRNDSHDYNNLDRIIFTGNMDYFPNIDAVQYFVKEIFPSVREKYPAIKFYIVGQKPVEAVKNLASENVIVTGFVEDLGAEYKKSSIAVSPIRFGAGTMNKVLEPMAMGIPVVCTEIGFKGLGVKSGEGVLLGKTKEEFTQHILNLLSSKELREKTGRMGTKVIYENYDWDIIAKKLLNYFSSVYNS
jgi:polysaccharide biosynthesis protein PslH